MKPQCSYEDFLKLHMVTGKIVEVQDFPRARKPAYKVRVDFGPEVGERWSSMQAKEDYSPAELTGSMVVGVVNFPPKNIAGFMSEALLLGVPAPDGSLSLLMPRRDAALGGEVH